MPRLRTLCRTLLGASLFIAYACAGATQTFGASIATRDVQLNVVDLTPNDGQVGGFTETSYLSFARSNIIPRSGAPMTNSTVHFEPWTGTTQISYGSAQASTTMGSGFGNGQTSSNATDIRDASAIFSNFQYAVEGMLAPHTAMFLSGHASATLNPSVAQSSASASLIYQLYNGTSMADEFSTYLYTDAYAPGVREFDFSLSFENNTDFAQAMTMRLQNNVFVEVSAVPEPSSYAMLGAGLLLLGAVARRRKNATQA